MNTTIEKLPTPTQLQADVTQFAAEVAAFYGSALKGIYLFGSHARGQQSADSDVDVAIVLSEPFSYWDELLRLSDFAYEYMLSHGTDIDARPVSEAAWEKPEILTLPSLTRAMRRDAKPIPIRP